MLLFLKKELLQVLISLKNIGIRYFACSFKNELIPGIVSFGMRSLTTLSYRRPIVWYEKQIM